VTEKYLPRPTVTITINLPVHVARRLTWLCDTKQVTPAHVIGRALFKVNHRDLDVDLLDAAAEVSS
jgi:hypothetical protein